MSYKNTDIILCYPGIGRTFYAQGKTGIDGLAPKIENSSFTLDLDFKEGDATERLVENIRHAKNSRKYRYILIPLNSDVRSMLRNAGIKYLLVAPKPEDKQIWIKRWLKAGATAELIAKRLNGWDTIGIHFDGELEWIYLSADEWLGNILQQSPMSDADGKDA